VRLGDGNFRCNTRAALRQIAGALAGLESDCMGYPLAHVSTAVLLFLGPIGAAQFRSTIRPRRGRLHDTGDTLLDWDLHLARARIADASKPSRELNPE